LNEIRFDRLELFTGRFGRLGLFTGVVLSRSDPVRSGAADRPNPGGSRRLADPV
jgi:hypothetical protein